MQELLDGVLFEPGRHAAFGNNQAPLMVPAEDKKLLATPFGILFNELQRSPKALCASLLSLLKQGLECDSGTPYSTEVELILYVIRVALRVEHSISFLVQLADGAHASMERELRDVLILPEILAELRECLATVQGVLREEVRNMLEGWIAQCIKKFKDLASDPEADRYDMGEHISKASHLHSHLILIHRNMTPDEWDVRSASIVLSSTIFLANR